MNIKRVIRSGSKNTRVELEDGSQVLIPNTELAARMLQAGEQNTEPTTDQVAADYDPLRPTWADPAQQVQAQPVTDTNPNVAPAHQSVAERFAHLESLVDLVIYGGSPSLIICGDTGVGKTYVVRQRLQKSGLHEQVVSADAAEPAKAKGKPARAAVEKRPTVKSYLFVKGYSSPMGLYQTLHNNRNAIIVFDDCDSVFKDAVSTNILKSALDSYDVRIVSWVSVATEKMGLESRFEFKGKIIFLSNLPLARLDPAVKGRSFSLEMTLTRVELWHRMNEVLAQIEPTVSMDIKLDALNHIALNMDSFYEFNMRTLIKAIRIRQSGNPSWKDMVLKFA